MDAHAPAHEPGAPPASRPDASGPRRWRGVAALLLVTAAGSLAAWGAARRPRELPPPPVLPPPPAAASWTLTNAIQNADPAPAPVPPVRAERKAPAPDPARERVAALLRELDIPADYPAHFSLEFHPETADLVDAGPDVYGRRQQLTPAAAKAWRAMKAAAARDGIQLDLVSGFRSVGYQYDLIRRKRAQGRTIESILRANTPPGYSQHHTGRAIDVTTPGTPVLEESFEKTPAFAWLRTHAARFGFELSYPRDNPQGVMYEPWHWFFTESAPATAARP